VKGSLHALQRIGLTGQFVPTEIHLRRSKQVEMAEIVCAGDKYGRVPQLGLLDPRRSVAQHQSNTSIARAVGVGAVNEANVV
jgi:hypothetical protein